MGLAPWHLLLIAMMVLLLFGNRLPEVMKSLGAGAEAFREGTTTCSWCGRQMPMFAEGCPYCRRPRRPAVWEQMQQRLAVRFQFSIRDLLWLIALIAVCVGWALDHRRLTTPPDYDPFIWRTDHVVSPGSNENDAVIVPSMKAPAPRP
jgi:TatA/E family protein of Tat protein translocase